MIENNNITTFEQMKHIDEGGNEFWYARELMKVLEYSQWRRFESVIDKAKLSCENSGNSGFEHFADVGKMINHPRPRRTGTGHGSGSGTGSGKGNGSGIWNWNKSLTARKNRYRPHRGKRRGNPQIYPHGKTGIDPKYAPKNEHRPHRGKCVQIAYMQV